MPTYAKNTEVTSDRSRAEIERTLTRFGADQYLYGWRDGCAVIGFRMADRMIRFVLPLPDRAAREFTHTSQGRLRVATAAQEAWEQACRQRWRALSLVIKAKLEAVESNISEFEQEFLANIVLPDGSTVAESVLPRVAEAYRTGRMPELLPMLPAAQAPALPAGETR